MQKILTSIKNWLDDRILKRVVKNAGYLILSNLISVFLTIYITRLLGVYNYGVLGLITSYVTNVNKLFSFRMNEMVVRYVGEAFEKEDLPKTAALIKFAALIETITSILAFLFMALTAKAGARILLDDESLYPLIIFYGTTILTGFAMETSNGVLRVINRYRSIALVSLLQNVLVLLIVLFASKTGLGLNAILFAYFIGKAILGIVPVILNLVWLPKFLGRNWLKMPLSLVTDRKNILKFTISTNISSTINILARDGELLWVGALLSPLYAGYYKTAMTVINMVLTPINPLIDTSYPELNRAVVAKKWHRVRRLVSKMTIISLIWTGAAFVGLLFLGKQLLFNPVIFGPIHFQIFKEEYLPAYKIIMILMAGYGLANVFFWNRTLLLAFSDAGYASSVSFYSMLIKVFFTIVLVPRGPYVTESVLLSAYLAGSVLVMMIHGLAQLRRKEIEEPEPPKPVQEMRQVQ